MAQMESPRRIAFVGASGTGKTSLIERLLQVARGYTLPMIQVGARTVAAEMGYASPYEVDAAGRRAEFQLRLLRSKINEELCTDSFVTDRSVADVLTYFALHDAKHLEQATIEETREAFNRYTHIFIC